MAYGDGVDDDSDLASPLAPETPPEERERREREHREAARLLRCKGTIKKWLTGVVIDWPKEYPDAGIPTDPHEIDIVRDLLPLDVGKLYRRLMESGEYYPIPQMAFCSRAQIGALAAESFCERVISVGNVVVSTLNTNLADDEVEWVTTLKANKLFMKWCRTFLRDIPPEQLDAANIRPDMLNLAIAGLASADQNLAAEADAAAEREAAAIGGAYGYV